jgi:two-component system response regulator FixJ
MLPTSREGTPPVDDRPTVFIVEGGCPPGRSLGRLVQGMRLAVEPLASVEEFLEAFDRSRPGCLLLDMDTAGVGGLEFLGRLACGEACPPVICISAHAEVPTVVRAMKAGAFDFLERPCRRRQLCQAVREALKQDAANRRRWQRLNKIHRRIGRLTPGEREVLKMISEGSSNAAAAARLGLSVRAIEVRRAKVMRKMRARSLAGLVRLMLLAEGLGDPAWLRQAQIAPASVFEDSPSK